MKRKKAKDLRRLDMHERAKDNGEAAAVYAAEATQGGQSGGVSALTDRVCDLP